MNNLRVSRAAALQVVPTIVVVVLKPPSPCQNGAEVFHTFYYIIMGPDQHTQTHHVLGKGHVLRAVGIVQIGLWILLV